MSHSVGEPGIDVELAATRLLARARAMSIWTGDAPIPVELIAEGLENLVIDWIPLVGRTPGTTVLGALEAESGVLCLNENQRLLFQRTIGLERFTIAHELGHFELHSPQVAGTTRLVCGLGEHGQREAEAEAFAASILMPADLVARYAHGTNTALWPRIYSLREIFGVSLTAMVIRLRSLGYETPVRSDRFESR